MRGSFAALALASALASSASAGAITITRTITTYNDDPTLELNDPVASSTITSLSEPTSETPSPTNPIPSGNADACSTVSSMFAASSCKFHNPSVFGVY
jgi:hypothetical protein